jgi:protein-L-isoaspartate(D-aspartate) O-methyltransferase
MAREADSQDYGRFVNRLADELLARKAIVSPLVEAAFRQVPRHLFIDQARAYVREQQQEREIVCDHARPDAQVLDLIYRDQSVYLGPSFRSTCSAPYCMAWMLEDLTPRPGMKVLEVGTGSGCNAALLAEIVGESSLVYSVELDEGLAESAKRHLHEAGYGEVTVLCGDGATGYASAAPYDAIIVTAGCADLSPAWVEQLAPDGAILYPFHVSPWDPTILVRRGKRGLRGRFTRLMNFVPCVSEVLGDPAEPETMEVSEARQLRTGPGQIVDANIPPRFRSSDSVLSYYLYYCLSLARDMRPEDRVVTMEGAFVGLADTSAREACIISRPGERIGTVEVIGGMEVLNRLTEIVGSWEKMGRPLLKDYRIALRPVTDCADMSKSQWVIDRKHYRYLISLRRGRKPVASHDSRDDSRGEWRYPRSRNGVWRLP